jgi:flagellar hook-associated protein 3 FlgL
MALRSVNPYTSYQVLMDLQRTKENLATLTEQIASGNRLTKLGDDPTASALVLNFQDSIKQNEAYIKQADSAASFLQSTETTLQSAGDSVVRLQELTVPLLGPTATASERLAIVTEVTGIRDNLVALANTQSQGKYIFAGTNTTTRPFTLDPATGNVTYAGDNNAITLDVSASTKVATNIPGDTAFFNGVANVPPTIPPTADSSVDIFVQVNDLLNGLKSNNAAGIQTAYNNLTAIFGKIQGNISDLGGRQSSLTQLKDNTSNYNLSLQSIQDSYQALDYPTASAEYSQAQLSQQASLSILAKSNNLSLFNYLT